MQATIMRSAPAVLWWPDLLLAYGHPEEWPMVPFRWSGGSHPHQLAQDQGAGGGPAGLVHRLHRGRRDGGPPLGPAHRAARPPRTAMDHLPRCGRGGARAVAWRKEYGDEVEMMALVERAFS